MQAHLRFQEHQSRNDLLDAEEDLDEYGDQQLRDAVRGTERRGLRHVGRFREQDPLPEIRERRHDVASLRRHDPERRRQAAGSAEPATSAIHTFPVGAVDAGTGPYSGRIYVVWPDSRNGDPDILLIWSGDGGTTWSAPVRVNDDAVGNKADQFFPWVHVDPDGRVQVTFLDRREDPNNFLFGAYLATSTNGGVSFGPNIRVSDGIYGPTNYGFLGDYTGAASGAASSIRSGPTDGTVTRTSSPCPSTVPTTIWTAS